MAKLGIFIVTMVTVFYARIAISESKEPLQLNFDSFVARVTDHHPEKSIDELKFEKAKSASERAGILSDPNLQFGRDRAPLKGSLQPKPLMAREENDFAMWKIGIAQNFPWPGTLAAEDKAAEIQVETVKIENDVSSVLRRLEAADLFLKIIRTQKLLEIEKENFKAVDGIRELTHEKFRQGVGSHHEFLQAHSESGILRINVSSLQTDLLNLKMHALFLINDHSITNIQQLTFQTDWPESFLNKSVDDNKTAPTNLLRSKFERQSEGALARQRLEYQRSLPTIMLSGEVMREDSGVRMYAAMLGVSLPLYSGRQRKSLSHEIDMVQKQTSETLSWQDRRRELAQQQGEARVSQLKSNLEVLEKDIIPPIKEHIEATTAQFGQGKIDIGSIIDARRAYLSLEVSRIRTTEALIRAKISLFKISAGLIDDEIDQEIPQMIGVNGSSSMPSMSSAPMKATNASKSPSRSIAPGSEERTPSSSEPDVDVQDNSSRMGM
ncbi:MAG: TolC family protein [Chitinophagaceae bacterium]|nr:TolC family protein [Oligoflexus sp.]